MPKLQRTKFKPKNLVRSLGKPFAKVSGEAKLLTGIGSVMGALITALIVIDVQEADFDREIAQATTAIFNEKSYRLVDDDIVETVFGNTVHRYHFGGRVKIINQYSDDVSESRKDADSNNRLLSSEMVRFEDLEFPEADDHALQAGLEIAQNLPGVFENARDRFFVSDEDEKRALYLSLAEAFIRDYGPANDQGTDTATPDDPKQDGEQDRPAEHSAAPVLPSKAP